jgi:hypothetical protein
MFTKRCMHAVLTDFMLSAVVGLAANPIAEAAVLFGDSQQSSPASTTAD